MGLSEHSGLQSAPNNAGIVSARGTHIAYLGHDDIWSPRHLEMLAAVLNDDRTDFGVTGCIFHGPPGSMYYQYTGLFDDSAAAAHEFFPLSSIAHRRDLIGYRADEGAHAPGKGRGYVNLNDRRPQNLPACACYFSDVTVLVWNRPGRAENHALDRLITQISRLNRQQTLSPTARRRRSHLVPRTKRRNLGVSAQFILRGRDKSCCERWISESWIDDCLYSPTEIFAFAKVPTPARQSGRLNLSCSSCQ